MQRGTLTFALMDPPSDCARTTIAKRLIAIAVRRGHDVNVFAYRGEAHGEPGGDAAHRNRSPPAPNGALPREWIASLMHEATAKGVKVDWVDCGCALDGGEAMLGVRRGSPADFWDMAANSHNMLVVSTP